MRGLAGRAAFVTGGGAGIGRATCLAFAEAGARVAVVDVDAARAEAVADEVAERGVDAVCVECDVSVEDDVARAVAFATDALGLDFCVNNAGLLGPLGPITEVSLEDFERTLDVNLVGLWLCMKHQLPRLVDRGGAIVNMGSVTALRAGDGAAAYSASKYGVLGLSRSAALEYGARGVRINALCPGGIATDMLRRSTGLAEARLGTPMGRVGTPEEVAAAALWLCSDDAAFVSGHALVLDGGILAG